MTTLEIKVKDQFDQLYDAKATIKEQQNTPEGEPLSLYQRVEKIEVDEEIILPSTELLFESQNSNRIYKIVSQ
ncbi:hypothetical protein IAE19_08805 [Acinetobacter sp. S40]|uniref:hypothetical protein n=1 Tax=unclassified Acinetobacter TaxID=196816 RepID=UPI00190D0AC5|nr:MULTISPECIES: hypothetical protein [unclassified Acinetobacter]MBJ9985542.1 hypothetical protein [Acinetobacter sp. S40]MBK0064511.1 hypothetical protein [Acinetobacter sp. S55]MBK0067942.1 hypothetical protein [Acinetobacter sp. S54]